jgi:hypothetical protein
MTRWIQVTACRYAAELRSSEVGNVVVHFTTSSCYKKNSVVLSPQANYTDWATATCRQNLVPTFVDRGVSRCQRGGSPTVVNLSFLDGSSYFSFNWLLIYPHMVWVDPVEGSLLLRKSSSAGNRTRDLWVSSQELWLLDHRSGHHLVLHIIEWRPRNTWERTWKEHVKAYLRTTATYVWKESEGARASAARVGAQAEIRTRHLSNTNRE